MLRVLARLCVVTCALWASQVFALGLGDINVKSKLNQPFSASIAVLGASSAQIDSLSVKLASVDDFNRAGIERSDYLSTLKFDIQEAAGGARVVISSDQIAREPFLNFIVEANSPDGKLLREYTVLLDPPGSADSAAAPAATYAPPAASYTPPAAPVVQVPASSAPSMPPAEAASLASQGTGTTPPRHGKTRPAKPAPVAAAPSVPPPAAAEAPAAAPVAATPAEAGGSSYGPIAPQETFWSIANKLRPGPQVSMDQVLLAIYRANPQAFDRGNFNGLLKGRTLQVPSLAQMQESSAAEAKTAVDAWRHGTRPGGIKKNLEATEPAVAPAPAKVEKPRPLKAKPAKPAAAVQSELPAPAPEPKPESSVAPAPAPQAAPPAASAPAATPAAEPAKPQAADNAAPAAPTSAPTPAPPPAAAATPPPADHAQPPAPAQSAADEVKKTTPPPPESSLFDDPTTLLGAAIFVVVIGAFAWFIFRRRKIATPDFTAKAPLAKLPLVSAKAPKAPVPPPAKAAPPPLPPKAQPAKPAEPPPIPIPKVPAPAPVPALDRTFVDSEPQLARTALEDTTQLKLAETALSEPIFDHTAKTKPVGGGDVDFDLTSQFEAQTLSVNLDANDPLSEADFHLAYGLYDEAASLLKQALVKEPQRQDLRLKLAETYFAGGKPMEFQETAEALHGEMSPTEWQKIAIMGRQLCPDSSLFKSDGNVPAPDIDLSLGDSIGPAPLQVLGTTSSRPAATQANVIDFDFESELNKSLPSTPRAAAPEATPAPAPASAEKADFDLSHFDLGAEPHPADGEGIVEFNLDELDLSKPSGGGHGVSSGDEIGTKLDLARVYADMGDNDAARGLLHEVLNTGNAAQKGEAEALIKRLSA